jgi:hypothetical protein
MKNWALSILLAFTIIAGGCVNSVMEDAPEARGTGNITVTLGEITGARTLLPDTAALYYTLQFTSPDYSAVTAVIPPGNNTITLALRQGTWNLVVNGYANQTDAETEGTLPLVSGVKPNLAVGEPGSTITIQVDLSASQTGTGGMQYSVRFPAAVSAAELVVSGVGGSPVQTINLLTAATAGEQNTRIAAGEITLNSGYYFLTMYLYLPDRTTAQIADVVHIYDALESSGEWVFTAADFSVPFDREALYNALNAANVAKTNIRISVNGNDVGSALQWVTQAVMNAFNAAIDAAETIYRNRNAASADIAAQVNSLTATPGGAIAVFNAAKAAGTAATTYRTVTFNANGGSVTEASRQVIDGNAIGALPAASRNGYQVSSWNTQQNGSGTAVTAAYTVSGGNITVWAQWTPGFTAPPATTGLPNSTLYEHLVTTVSATYDTGYYGDASNVLRLGNSAGGALTISFTPNFSGQLKLNFAANVMRSTAGKIVWENQAGPGTAVFGSDTASKSAETWHSFSVTDMALTVTSGTPVVFRLSDGGDNGAFTWYLKNFSMTAKRVVSMDVSQNFENAVQNTDWGKAGTGGATVTVETFNGSNILKTTYTGSYQQTTGGWVKLTIPSGKTLANYSKITFDGDAITGSADANSKSIIIGIYNAQPTSCTSSKTISVSGAQAALRAREITVSSLTTTQQAYTGDLYLSFSINANSGYLLGIDNVTLQSGASTEDNYPLY